MPKPFPSNLRLGATHVETGPNGAVFSVRVDLNDPSDALDVQRTYGLVSALKQKPAERRQDGRARTQYSLVVGWPSHLHSQVVRLRCFVGDAKGGSFRTFGGYCPLGTVQTRFALANHFGVSQTQYTNIGMEVLTVDHRSVAIIPSSNLDASETFYKRLGFDVIRDYGQYRILADGRGWHLHLTHASGWPKNIEDNPIGLYLYVDDVDAVAARVCDLIIEKGTPHPKPWGTYEFAVSDPSGLLVRVGRIIDQE